jgi:ATP diphosphatase
MAEAPDDDGARAARALELTPPTGVPRLDAVARVLAIVDRLRAPDGCPWDREQTLATMAPHLVEEAHELREAVETGDDAHAAEEAGDVLMTLALLCRIAEESGRFDLARSAQAIGDKLIRRHPHVFGDATAGDARQALGNWERVKQAERAEKRADASALAGVPATLPALQRAQRLCGKAVAAGFRWPGAADALAKLREELGELERELPGDAAPPASARAGEELGDVLLAAAFLAQYLELDAEALCRAAARRFEQRFRAMERALGAPLAGQPLERLMQAWQAAKAGGA